MTLDEYKTSLNGAKNEAAVIYLSELKTICKLPTAEERDEAFRLFLFQALTEQAAESDNLAVDMFLSAQYPSQISRRQNHSKAVKSGEQGGRPETVNRDKVFELRNHGFTQQQIANELGCHVNTVRNILNTTNNNQQKPTVTTTETTNNLKIKSKIEIETETEDESEIEIEKKKKNEIASGVRTPNDHPYVDETAEQDVQMGLWDNGDNLPF